MAETAQRGGGPGFVEGLQQRMARQLNVQVADWLDTCRELVGWEDQHLVEGCGPESLSEHTAMLNRLEGMGQWLTAAAVTLDPDPPAVARQIESALQDLRDSRSMWHGNTPPARRQEILRDCFQGPCIWKPPIIAGLP